MTRWNLSVPEETDRLVRIYLVRAGKMKKGAISSFVEQACRAEILRRTVDEVHDQNRDLDPDEAMRLADEALAAVRADPS